MMDKVHCARTKGVRCGQEQISMTWTNPHSTQVILETAYDVDKKISIRGRV